jgi:rhodanese-related sulfurtransferase
MTPDVLPAIDVDAAASAVDDVLLDVREHEEWIRGHAPEAVHIPMTELPARLGELDRSKRIICICRSGNRSSQVTRWLCGQGFDAVNMSGGMSAWAAHGHPLVNLAGNPGLVI